MTKKSIYLDHSATTPLDKKVLDAMMPYLKDNFGNASSLHSVGQKASTGVETARRIIVDFFHCKDDEIIFTSGATESNNMVIFGVAKALKQKYPAISKPHIITSQIEHPAIMEPCGRLEEEGYEVTYLPVSSEGIVDISEVEKAIKKNTILASVMYANNEVGTIQPIAKIGNLIENINKERKKDNKIPQIVFHTDAVQALYYQDCNVKNLKVDLLSLSGHKIYGPKGVGVLYVKKGTPLSSLTIGGHQENNIRSGTYNSPAIVGLGKAVELITKQSHKKELKKIKKLRDYLIEQIEKKIPNIKINGSLKNRIVGNINISFIGAEGESMLIMLDMEGVAISTGSACSSGSLKPSHVLTAMGVTPETCHSSLRMTLGKFNTKTELDYVVDKLMEIVEKLRNMAP